jgi:chromosome segregation ATPase
MARLSGLASKHHPEGPGDVRRRKGGRKSKTPSMDAPSASGTKRAASPSVEVPATHPKRAKRAQADDHDQLERELEESTSRSQVSETVHVANTRRRYSEPFATFDDEEEEDEEDEIAMTPVAASQPAPGLTPHLQRIGALRGRSSRHARMSMPAHLEVVEETDTVREVQFAPLRTVIGSRMKRRLRRSHLSEETNEIEHHDKEDAKLRKAFDDVQRQLQDKESEVNKLKFDLEASRLGNIDITEDQVIELQQQLDVAQQEIDELRASSVYDGGDFEDDDDDGPMMLIEPDELGVSQKQLEASPNPNGFYASRVVASQVTIDSLDTIPETTRDSLTEASHFDGINIPDRLSEQAEQRYKSEIEELSQALALSKGTVRLLTIELQNLDIIGPGASATDILTKLRHVLEDSRDQYEKLYPGATTDTTNAAFIKMMIEDITGMHDELLEKVTLTNKQSERIQLLTTQFDGAIEKLAESNERILDLEQASAELEEENEVKMQELIALDSRITSLQQVVEEKDETIRANNATIEDLRQNLDFKETDLARLLKLRDDFTKEVDTLTETVLRLENDHQKQIGQMEADHALAVADFQAQLIEETAAREEAQNEAQQKSDYIDELEANLQNLESEVAQINDQVVRVTQRLTEETESRAIAEGEREEQTELAYERANSIEDLTEKLEALQSQILEYRDNLDTERAQRVQTEADLDAANIKIEGLNETIHTLGVQANELRSKLWAAQQEREDEVRELKAEIQDLQDQHVEVLTIETQRRQDSESEGQALQARIVQLEQTITEKEEELEETISDREILQTDRDTQVTQLTRQLDDLTKQYNALESNASSTIEALQSTITDLTNEVKTLAAARDQLELNADEAARQYAEDIATKNEVIEDLQTDLAASRAAHDKSIVAQESLERRLENEAIEFLNLQSTTDKQVQGLSDVVSGLEAQIAELEATRRQRAEQHEEDIARFETDVEALRIVGETRGEHIVLLEANIEELKRRFQEQTEDNQKMMDALLETNRKTVAQQEQLVADKKLRDIEALDAVKEMKVKGFEIKARAIDLKKIINGKVTKSSDHVGVGKKGRGGHKKRDVAVRDSAYFGTNSDEETTELELADGAVA